MPETTNNETEMKDIDFYILKFNQEKQERLQKIRAIIQDELPAATERIYYGVPTVEIDGKVILQYAAYKKHISFIVGKILSAILKEKYPEFNYTEYSVVIPDNMPVSEDFIKEICKIGRIDWR